MNSQMFRQCRTVREGFLAHVASIGPFSRMRPHVSCDRRTLREPSVTNLTSERLFPAVRAYVGGQIGSLREGLVACGTAIRPFPRMSSHVGLQGTRSRIGLPTDSTQIHLPRRVRIVGLDVQGRRRGFRGGWETGSAPGWNGPGLGLEHCGGTGLAALDCHRVLARIEGARLQAGAAVGEVPLDGWQGHSISWAEFCCKCISPGSTRRWVCWRWSVVHL